MEGYTQAFIALGSNIEPRSEHLNSAIEMLQSQPNIRVISQSSLYETKPVGYLDQANFYNMVIEIATKFTVRELLSYGQSIEERLMRVRLIKNGPRTIDVDILAYGQAIVREPDLEIPHPRLAERAFVLVPWAEIRPDFLLPDLGQSVSELVGYLPKDELAGIVKVLNFE